MFEYDYAYKHLMLKVKDKDIVIELSVDNMYGDKTYSAKTNLSFLDEDETWGKACGIGKNETAALNMCLAELERYTHSNLSANMCAVVDLPKRITFIYKKKTGVVYFKMKDGLTLLTSSGKEQLLNDDVLSYVKKNAKRLINESANDENLEFYIGNDFYPTFEGISKRDE